MSRVCRYISLLLTIGFLCLAGCDTAESIGTEYNDYFVKYYGGAGDQQGVDLLVDEDDATMVLLGTSTVDEISRLILMKIDWDGNVLWTKKLGAAQDQAMDIEKAHGGGYVLLAESVGADSDADVKLTWVSVNGELLDSIVYAYPIDTNGNIPNEYPSQVTKLTDGYAIVGSTDRDTDRADGGALDVSDMLYIKLGTSLDSIFSGVNSVGYTDYGVDAVQISDTAFHVLGASYKIFLGEGNNFNFRYFSVNDDGVARGDAGELGDKTGNNNEILKALCPALVNGYFLVGTHNNNSTVSNMYIGNVIANSGKLKPVSDGQTLVISSSGVRRQIEPIAACPAAHAKRQGYLILGNEGSDVRNIWLTKVDELYGVEWSVSFGAAGGNDDTAGAVAELPDGSIVVLGTVNLGDENALKMAFFKLNSEGKFSN